MSTVHVQIDRLLEVGRVREARELLHRALSENPGDPDLHVFAARIATRTGDLAEARRQLSNALASDPTHFGARAELCDLEWTTKDYAAAEQIITELIREAPRNAALLASYARLMLVTLHLPKARALVNEALRLEPEDETARLVDVLLSTVEGDRRRADAQLQDLVAEDPDGYYVAHMLLVALIEQNRNREALALARQLMRAHPDDEDLVQTVVDLAVATHWLSWPLWPLRRFGWAASAALWLGAVTFVQVGRSQGWPWQAAVAFAVLYLTYVIYSWVYTPVMTRWIRSRGAR
jgi:predicted Zn-dependent protease